MMEFSSSQEANLCLCLMLLFQLSEGALKFTLEPPNPSCARNGSNAKLVWDYSVDNPADLDGIIFSVEVSGGTFTNMVGLQSDGTVINFRTTPDKYKGRVKAERRASLVIEDITPQDNSTFMCNLVVKPGAGSDVRSQVKLIVTVAPQISISSVASSYIEGSVVNITCTASGIPEPEVKWFKNGIMESKGTKTALLTFYNVSRTDDGRYKCRANNSAGNTENYVALVVHYKPEGTTLTTRATDNTVIQGDTVTFTCHVTAAKPQVLKYIFSFNDTTMVKDSKGSQYTIYNVQRSQHNGKYKCAPSNDAGDGPEATVTLIVNVPTQFTALPKNLTVNETNSILLSCDASGFPEPSFTWTKSGKILSESKQLNIQRSYRNNTGTYVCTASNGVGQDKTAKSFVTVQYPPTIKTIIASSDKSWIGQTVTLKCVSDGFPTPTLTWYKPDGSQINSDMAMESTVDVEMRLGQDFGVYKCAAGNGLAPADQMTVEIKQIMKPGFPTIEKCNIEATSLTVKWTVPADDGGSPITAYRVVILKGGTEIKNVNITDPGITSLSVGDLERDTEYTLKVFARNALFEGPAGEKEVRTKYKGIPSAATIDDLPNEVTDDAITLRWSEPQNNGRVITRYTVYQRIVTDDETGEWIMLKTIADVSVRELKVELESGKVYEFVVTATNELGESLKEDEKITRIKALKEEPEDGGDDGTQTGEDDNRLGAAIYAGVAAAGVLLIIGIIVIIVLWRRRKPSSDEDTSRDELGSPNPYEEEDGYPSVSREAAQSLQASGPAAEPNYAQVDQSRKKKNRMPANDEYAQVDKSKKSKKKKKPGELDYADLEDLRADIQLGPVPSGGAAAAAPIVRPPAYEGTEYADISQFGVPQPDPTYANVPKQEVVYSNVESM